MKTFQIPVIVTIYVTLSSAVHVDKCKGKVFESLLPSSFYGSNMKLFMKRFRVIERSIQQIIIQRFWFQILVKKLKH